MKLMTWNIFNELSQHMPPEDFATTSFCFLLRQDSNLTLFLLKEILKRESKSLHIIRKLVPSDFEVVAQETYLVEGKKKRKIDIRISARNFLRVLIENKMGAQVTERQMRDYFQIAQNLRKRREAEETYVLFITEREIPGKLEFENLKEQNFLHCLWADIFDILRTYSTRNLPPEKGYYVSSFLEFLEGKGVLSFKGFAAADYSSAWHRYSDFRDNAKALLREIKKRIEKKGFSAWSKEPIEEDVRIGLNFRKKNWKWTVALWTGFELIPIRGKSGDEVWYSVDLWFRKRFREYLRKNFKDETDEAAEALGNDFAVEWDQDMIYLSYVCKRLPKQVQDQKRLFFKFVDYTIDVLEKSGLLILIDKALKEYE